MSIRYAAWRQSSRSAALAATSLWLLCTACSDDSHRLGSGALSLSGPPGQRQGLCSLGADFEFIDSMEDQDGSLDFTEGRAGTWFSYNDKTTGTQTPPTGAETFPITELDPPRENSRYAINTYGGNFEKWGSGIGFDVHSQHPYDASRYAGISFWARRAARADEVLRFVIPDKYTSPLGHRCYDADVDHCHEDFGFTVKLGTEFAFYSFTWAEMVQPDWATEKRVMIDPSSIYGMRFQTDLVSEFDFWIDDVALLCH